MVASFQSSFFSIGSFQAKTYFAELLRKVENGAIVTITRNGHDVAVMQSPAKKAFSKGAESWRRLMGISQAISAKNGDAPVMFSEINEWKNDGRK